MKKIFLSALLIITTISTSVIKCERVNYEMIDAEAERRELLISAIIEVESGFVYDAVNSKEMAVGGLQIRPIMVREVNRLLGENRYSHSDAFCIDKSIEMFTIFQNKHNPNWDCEVAARLWNGGGRGMKKKSTEKYWEKVKNILDIQKQ